MKKFRKYIQISVALLLSGCYSLDQSPYETFGEQNAFKTPADAQAWVNGMYSSLRNTAYGNQMVLPEVQTDLLNITNFSDGVTNNLHRWETFLTNESTTAQVWQDSYKALANINKALVGFEQIADKQAIRYNQGEMYLARAYYYTTLVTLFCKAYEPATASTELGLPLILNDDFTQKTPRSSLKATYEQILSDITKAQTLLSGKYDENGSSFTEDSAKSLKARVLLYMQEWQQAYAIASELIESGNYPLSDAFTLGGVWHNDDISETITQLFAGKTTEEQSGNQLVRVYLGRDEYKGQVTGYLPAFLPTQSIIDLYEDSDARKFVYFLETELFNLSTGEMENRLLVHKFPGNPALKIGNDVSYAHQPKIFRIGEIYTIAFEAAYRKGDEANALRFLNELKEARGLNPVSVSGTDLYEEIKNERTRELAFEGFRLIDLKRWKQAVKRGTPQNESLITTDPADQHHQLNRPATDYKFVWPIPIDDISVYPNIIQQNTGW